MIRTVEQSAMRKVYLRILPFAVLTYFFCYLDRINVGFAALDDEQRFGSRPGNVRDGGRRLFLGLCAV